MDNFPFIKLGYDHILDTDGYDHILFILVLCASFALRDWRKILLLATAFTLGHSFTLALSALKIINIDAYIVELAIAISIFVSAIFNLYSLWKKQFSMWLHYFIASAFGLIHGLGFSNFFKALTSGEDSFIGMLFSFNVGVELGQILIVLLYLVVVALAEKGLGVCQKYIGYFISIVGVLESLRMIIERF